MVVKVMKHCYLMRRTHLYCDDVSIVDQVVSREQFVLVVKGVLIVAADFSNSLVSVSVF